MHRDRLGQEELRSWDAFVQRGAELEGARSYAEALKVYLEAAKIDGEYAELEFRIARALWVLGDNAGAKQHFLRARDLDTLHFRADSKINDINRSVASSSPGAELVDAEEIFSKQSPSGVIGSELVYEHVHMTPLGNYLLARAMFLQIARKMPAEAGRALTEDDVLSETDCERLLAFTSHDRRRIAVDMLERLQKPPFTNQLNYSDQVLRLMWQAQVPEENPEETTAEYEWAIAQKPDDILLRYNYGLFLFAYNRNAAIVQLRLTRPWDGFPVYSPDGVRIE
jgi:tetratricopeptide (TPR) repeat protein